jgi:hypothetical protein
MKRHPDLSNCDKSVTSRLLTLLKPEYHKISLNELKEVALEILNDPETHVSVHKRKEYELNIARMKSLTQFQFYLANLTMKGCNLSLNS